MTLEDVLRDPELIPLVRRWLFEALTAGSLPLGQAAAVARRIGVVLEAERYAIALFDLPVPDREDMFFSDPAVGAREALLAFFLKYSQYMPVQLTPGLGAVLVKGGAGDVPALTDQCVRRVREEYDRAGVKSWHMAVSGAVSGLAELPACWEQASRLWALRVALPDQRVFQPGAERALDLPEREPVPDVDPARTDPEIIRAFLETGRREDVPAFAARYVRELGPAMGARSFRDFTALNVRYAAERYVAALGVPPARYGELLGPESGADRDPERLLTRLLTAAIELREQTSAGPRSGTLGAALGYVDSRFAEPDLTLTGTAAAVSVTASYLSALFRRELGRTFTQYVTGRRMELACRLLRTTDRRPGQIARDVGFRDGRYFSALFKKTVGCTPSQFRAGDRGCNG